MGRTKSRLVYEVYGNKENGFMLIFLLKEADNRTFVFFKYFPPRFLRRFCDSPQTCAMEEF